MIDREHHLPITKQAEVLRISRGSVYYLPDRCRTPTARSCGRAAMRDHGNAVGILFVCVQGLR
jgi:hypothetical protein